VADVNTAARYAIGDLARLAGVSRRTVRYYVQEGLIAAPLGVGRGNHYSAEHLDQILRVKAMQEAGRTLDEIRNAGKAPRRSASAHVAGHSQIERSLWRRLTLAPGVELHVSSHARLPSAARLQELADWCRDHFPTTDEEDEGNHA
jgi:DNA-binding transcriptional MerR regulator